MEKKMEQVAHYKEVMGNYPTGVTVVTAFDENGEPMGMTVNSFASVSLDPLLILWSIDKGAHLYEQFLKADQFAVNILADDQSELCSLFASRTPDRFERCKWEKSPLNLPVLENSLATLQCKTFKQVEAGDHVILIGEIVEIEKVEKAPLLYHKRTMGAIPASFYEA